jgi:hypothetical protein
VSAYAVDWVTAAPLWTDVLHGTADASERTRSMRRPALLRFESDTFMADLAALLHDEPRELRSRLAGAKLFHPARGHFNLVAATLACRRPGLPDHKIDARAGETAAFVLRKRDEDDDGSGGESAWVGAPSGSGRAWRAIAPAAMSAVASGEELLPLFGLRYDSADGVRRLLVGLVPASAGDAYAAAQPPPALGLGAPARYVIRCVYRRPRCAPRADVVSEPSDPFELAGFFDLDAPQRPGAVAPRAS